MPPTRLERPAQAFLFPSEESLFGPPSSPSPEASPPRSAMPLILKGRWVNNKLVGDWVDDNDHAVPLVDATPLGLVSYKKPRIERRIQRKVHECEEK